MSDFYTCYETKTWKGCGKTHASYEAANKCCIDFNGVVHPTISNGTFHPRVVECGTRAEVSNNFLHLSLAMKWALVDRKAGNEECAHLLLTPVGTNKVGLKPLGQWGRVFNGGLERMKDGQETSLYQMGDKSWEDARKRSIIAQEILKRWPTRDQRLSAMRSVVEAAGSAGEPVGPCPPGWADEPKPEPKAEEPAPKKELSDKAKVLRELLELDEFEEQVFEKVMAKIADNQDLLDKISERANVPRPVVFSRPDMEPITMTGHRHPDLEIMLKAVTGGVKRVLTWGAPGLGKTHAAIQLAKAMGSKLFIQTPVADQYQLLGFKDATGEYHETAVYRWATSSDDTAVLLLDEVDGCHPNAVLALNAMLENNMGVFPGGSVEFSPSKVVIATANTDLGGADSAHNARLKQDDAFRDRFVTQFRWQFCEKSEEIIAGIKSGLASDVLRQAVEASRKVRKSLESNGIQLAWSPRRTFAVAKMVAAGFTNHEACEYAGLHTLDEGQRKRALEGVA